MLVRGQLGIPISRTLLGLLVCLMVLAPLSTAGDVFEGDSRPESTNPIDSLVEASLGHHGLSPANLCSDSVFLRRVYLDTIGQIPKAQEVRQFLRDTDPGKRSAVIDELLDRSDFAEYWALKWCDLLRVKAEFPINLWPNGVQAYHRWLLDALRGNMPYDEFARELLTSSGSNFRVPQVNFYRAIQGREPAAIAEAAALTFMGTRIENWPETERANLEAFFSRVAYKGTAEWKEEIVYLDPSPHEPLEAVFPDGVSVKVSPGADPRQVFADWLIADDNPWFSRNIVNRVWSWLLGRGIIHEADDIRPDNPPRNPELLALLEKELAEAEYDLEHIYRLILNSSTYQQSSIPQSPHAEAEALFACYAVRPLEAEVLIDALDFVLGSGESYESPIPEPFTFIPKHVPSIALADGSITSSFLELFGRPPRDSGLEAERGTAPSDAQRLHLLNSSHIQSKIDRSRRLRNLMRNAKNKPPRIVRLFYLNILSRRPTESELAAAENYLMNSGLSRRQAANDLAWALINSKEFLYRH